ncbi:MAG: hypothetical protein GX221_05655 [Candidatus Riflebacteria bacterium]|nr:hypothetical protein [Candidatus Riflebacteria bacterium]
MNKKNIILISLLFAVFLSEALAYKPGPDPYEECRKLLHSLIDYIYMTQEENAKFPPDFLGCEFDLECELDGRIPMRVFVEQALVSDYNSLPSCCRRDCDFFVAPWALSGNGIPEDIYCSKHGFLSSVQVDSDGSFIEAAEYMKKRCQEAGIDPFIADEASARFNPNYANYGYTNSLQSSFSSFYYSIGSFGTLILHLLLTILVYFIFYHWKLMKGFSVSRFIIVFSGIFLALEAIYLFIYADPAILDSPLSKFPDNLLKLFRISHLLLVLISLALAIKYSLFKKQFKAVELLVAASILGVFAINFMSCIIGFLVSIVAVIKNDM